MKKDQHVFVRKRVLFALLFGIALLGFMAFPVLHASAAPVSVAHSQQTWVQQQTAMQLQRKPGGKLIDGNELSYDNGKILVKFTTPDTGAFLPNTGYGGCPEGYTCVWNGTNYGGSGVFVNATYCHTGPTIDLWTEYGFIGVRSYSSTNGATVPLGVVDEWGNTAFWILPGAQHHSSDTSFNSDAKYARWLSTCLG